MAEITDKGCDLDDKLLVEWRKLESTETDKYLEGWVKFQQWFNDYLPVVPLYANEYFVGYVGLFISFIEATGR